MMRIPKGIEFKQQYIITTIILCRYMFLSSNEKVVRGKKGSSGVHIYKTSQVIMTKRSFPENLKLVSCQHLQDKSGDNDEKKFPWKRNALLLYLMFDIETVH